MTNGKHRVVLGDYVSHCITPKEVQLWYARGLPGQYWVTKGDCEAAVRKAFPDEEAHSRYARVFYTNFFKEN